MIEVAGADLAGTRRQQLHRTRDALREVQPGPGRADQDHQRHHDEQRQIDARESGAASAVKLAAVLVCLDDLPRVRRPTRPRGSRSPARRRRPGPSRRESLRRRARVRRRLRAARVHTTSAPPLATSDARGGRADARTTGAGRTGRFDGNERHDVGALPGLRPRSVDFDQPDAALRDLGLDRAAHGAEIARLDCRRPGCRARSAPRGCRRWLARSR